MSAGKEFFLHPRDCWPAIAEVLPKPWTEEMVEADCAYWFGEYERMEKGLRHALPLLRGEHRISRRWCAKRWGWTEYAVGRELAQRRAEWSKNELGDETAGRWLRARGER